MGKSSIMSSLDNKTDHKGYRGGGHHGKTDHQIQGRADDQQAHVKEKQPTLRGATITGMHAHRPRAGTFGSRKETFHSTASKDKQIRSVKDDRQSQATEDYHVHQVDYENTYKMEPDLKFQERQVKDIISAALKENLDEKEYDHSTMNRRITLVCSKILEGVKQLDLKRYKLVSHVLVGENKDSTLQFSSRCLWDKRWDTCISATIKIGNIYATGLVFGIYAE